MYDRELRVTGALAIECELCPRGDQLGRREDHDVLPIERENGRIRPDERPNPIHRDVAMIREECSPIIGPLLV
jgi:hypothetical protein